jgi:hypothetical protein
MKKLLLSLLALAACTESKLDEKQLQLAVSKALKAGPRAKTAFLTFEYGDTREEVSSKMSGLINSGALPDGRFTFERPESLAGQEWTISTHFHNDSLKQISLVWVELDKIPTWAFNTVRDEYKKIYGAPVAEAGHKAVFLKGEQRVDVQESDHMLLVDYQNTRLEASLFNRIQSSRHDESGSYDSAYYNRVVKPRQPKNPNGI